MHIYSRFFSIFFFLVLIGSTAHAQHTVPTGDHVRLKSGRVLQGSVHVTGLTPLTTRIRVNDSTSFHLSEVSLVRSGGRLLVNYGEVRRGGQVRDRLIAQTVEGRLDLFAPYPIEADGGVPTHFRKGEGTIYPVEFSYLRPALSDHPESVALLNRARYYEWGSEALLVGGIGLAALGLKDFGDDWQANAKGNKSWGTTTVDPATQQVVAGIGVAVLSIIPRWLSTRQKHRALRTYVRTTP